MDLKPIGLGLGKASKSKFFVKIDDTIQFEAREMINIFKKLYSELPGDLQEKLQKASNKFTSQTTKNYFAKTSFNVSNDVELSNVSEEVIKKIINKYNQKLIRILENQKIYGNFLKILIFRVSLCK